jgi:UDP-glucose 4-epimerase
VSVLVTGAGVIGTLTASLLADAGEEVVLADVRPPEGPSGRRIRREQLDVLEHEALDRLVISCGVTRIVHTAAMLSTGIRSDPLAGYRINVIGTANVLETARRRGLARVVLASSTTVSYAVFKSHGPEPIAEDFGMRIQGERPTSIYAATKLANEHLALLYADIYGVDCIVLRYGAVIGGPLDAPTSVPGRLLALLAEAAARGRARLDDPLLAWGGREEFIDARDCARANVLAIKASTSGRRVFNLANGGWQTMQEFADAGKRALGPFELELPSEPAGGFAGFPHRRPARSDISAAREQLSFAPMHDLGSSIGFWAKGGA